MSAPVDVLRVLEQSETALIVAGLLPESIFPRELREARDAVAELIEQRDTLLNALKQALPHVEHAYHTHEDLDGSFWIDVVGCRNAIARVQGVNP